MNKKLKTGFAHIQAEEELIKKTKECIFQKTKGYQQIKARHYRKLIPVFACMLLLLFGGNWLFFTPTVQISMDINPSIELGINRFNQIISCESYNADGEKLLQSVDVRFSGYSEGVNQIMESETIQALLSQDEIMTIAVTGEGEKQAEKIFSDLQSCAEGKPNTYCYYAHGEEIEKAHEAGLSYGKYKAYLELQELKPDITIEQIKNMTMQEIRAMIRHFSKDDDQNTDFSKSNNGKSNNGKGNNGRVNNGKGSHEKSQNEKSKKEYGKNKKYLRENSVEAPKRKKSGGL